jgi:RimJ/RimL family protein N-acetyltransferase
LLERDFDVLAIRVGRHTHHRNEGSQRAIKRLGAQRDGVLRSPWRGLRRPSRGC